MDLIRNEGLFQQLLTYGPLGLVGVGLLLAWVNRSGRSKPCFEELEPAGDDMSLKRGLLKALETAQTQGRNVLIHFNSPTRGEAVLREELSSRASGSLAGLKIFSNASISPALKAASEAADAPLVAYGEFADPPATHGARYFIVS